MTVACTCDCSVCVERDANGVCVRDQLTTERSVDCIDFLAPVGTACEAHLDDVVAQGALRQPAACPQACETDLRANAVDLLGCGPRTETVLSKNDCIDSVGSPLNTTANGNLRADKLRCDSGASLLTIVRRLPGGAVLSRDSAPVSCDAEVHSGSFHLDLLRMRADGPITAGPTSFSNIRIGLISPLLGSIDSSGTFVFDVSQSNFALTTTSGGSRLNFVFAPTASVVGNYDRVHGQFAADLAMQSEDGLTDLVVHLSGTTENRAPSAVISGASTVECANHQGLVELSALGSTDPDGMTLNQFLWYEGSTPIGSGPTLSTRLALGQHTIRLLVLDGVSLGESSVVVSVVDTQPPVVAIQNRLACAWPPNHKMMKVLLGRDVIATANDACDGQGTIEGFTAATSSQPDNGAGDGDTVGDVVFSRQAACLRVERAGVGGQARTYELEVTAVDGAGHRTTATTAILVGHDQGNPNRCPLNVEPELIDAPAAECIQAAPTAANASPVGENPVPPENRGCMVAPGPAAALLGLWWLFLGSRRSSRSRGERAVRR